MRLIDADKLSYDITTEDEDYLTVTYDEIQDQPTVEAIPIEWLREWFKRRYKGRTYRDLIEEWESEKFWEKQND